MSTVKLLCNAGVRLTLDSAAILIDPFYGGGCRHYVATPEALFDETLRLGADALVYTHLHPDHFDLAMTLRFMEEWPDTSVIVPAEIAILLSKNGADMKNAHALSGTLESFRAGPVSVTALPTRHIGPRFADKEHYSLLVEGSERILHTGDASPVQSNYVAVSPGVTDTVIAGYPYLISGAGMRLFTSAMPIRQLIVVHLPARADDPEGIRAMADAALNTDYPYAVLVPECPGEEIVL